MTDITIGDLRHRVRIERPVRAPDEGGGAVIAWALEAEVWAALKPLSGTEREEADRLVGRVTHELVARYRPGVTPEMRVMFGLRAFDIRAAIDFDEKRRWLKCMIEERIA